MTQGEWRTICHAADADAVVVTRCYCGLMIRFQASPWLEMINLSKVRVNSQPTNEVTSHLR